MDDLLSVMAPVMGVVINALLYIILLLLINGT